jgi:hypothetical protein
MSCDLSLPRGSVTPANSERIWFSPPKFWAATKGVPPEEADDILDEVLQLAAKRDLNVLQKFEFIRIGEDWRETRKAS